MDEALNIINLIGGPILPYFFDKRDKQITKQIKKLESIDYFKRFPKSVHIARIDKKEVLELPIKEAFCFSSIRLLLLQEWDIARGNHENCLGSK